MAHREELEQTQGREAVLKNLDLDDESSDGTAEDTALRSPVDAICAAALLSVGGVQEGEGRSVGTIKHTQAG
ncbi:hypothetical protein ACLOJK_011586 [Asimina triloba]